jgi:hypothetical protein
MDIAKLKFKYRRLSAEQKLKLLERLRERFEGVSGVVFAYVYGSFVERDSFRDLDVAVWIRSVGDAFYYTVDFSAKLEVEMGVPIDVQVLNEAPLPFKHYVFTRGRLLFSKDENACMLRLVDEVVRQYIDLKQLKRFQSARVG